MKILFCNKYNYRFSGTEVYLFELMELLRSHGHEVALFSMADPRGEATPYDRHFVPHINFKQPAGLFRKAQRASHAIYSRVARQRLRVLLSEFRPDVAHLRNIYHHLSPSILWELKAHNIPVIYHLNDFKLLCPSYNLVSRGKTCEACAGRAFWHALQPTCYPGLGVRLTLTSEAYVHDWLGTYRKCVDFFLAPSEFVRDKFVEYGWRASKFEVLPHFQKVHDIVSAPGNTILYFGRLSAEKGVADLLRAMQKVPQMELIIAGDGPQRRELEGLADSLGLSSVRFLGHVDPEQRDSLISQSLFTVLPSHAYETLGKTILESYALGRPVVASDMGSRREFVEDGQTGLLYQAGNVDQLSSVLRLLASRPQLAEKMGRAGWDRVCQHHSPEGHYEKLLTFYERVIAFKPQARTTLTETTVSSWLSAIPRKSLTVVGNATPGKLKLAFIGGRGVISKYSGIEAYYEEVGRRLAEMGHDVTVYCRAYFTPRQPSHNGMRLVHLPTVRSKHLETVVHTMLCTAHAMVHPYDVVHYHALGPALFSLFPRLVGKKTAVTVQGLDWQRKKWGRLASTVLQLGERASVIFPNGTTVVSQALQQRFREMHGIEAFYVPNGGLLRERVQPNKILELALEPDNYVLFLGRFSPEKGCHLLVEAFEQVKTDAKLVMAGASSYCDDYARALHTHASDRIRMFDWVCGDTLDELLTNAMFFVLPSDLEGLSLALLDAMGAGLCVLTSDVPENREVVDGAGFTFKRGDVKDLAEHLRLLIANPELRKTAGQAARRRIQEQYDWQLITKQIEKAYFALMGWNTTTTSGIRPAQLPAEVKSAEGPRRLAG
jgi:glycosyltransferase involved in cell wall biosynthesis